MKRILFLVALFATAVSSIAQTSQGSQFQRTYAKSLDYYFGKTVNGIGWPWASTAEANAGIPITRRYDGMFVLVGADSTSSKLYYYHGGRGNGNLQVFTGDTTGMGLATRAWVTENFSGGGGGSGTVTSVGIAAPSGFSVSGSPVTGSGTITISAPGNSTTQYINGAGGASLVSSLPVSTAQQTALDLKANIASPTFTGTPTAPTATAGTNTTQIATTAFVQAAVNASNIANTVWVNTTGNDGTAVVGDINKPYLTLNAAADALPSTGGTINIGVGTFAPITTGHWKNNIKLNGSGRGTYNWTVTQTSADVVTITTLPTKIVGGTIIAGTLRPDGVNGVEIKHLGVDLGPDFITGGGTASDCIVYNASTVSAPFTMNTGTVMEDLILLGSGITSPYHCLAMQGQFRPRVVNVKACNSLYGFALKNSGGYYNNLEAYEHGDAAIILKGNAYAPSLYETLDGFMIGAKTGSASGLVLQTGDAGYVPKNIIISNGQIFHVATGIGSGSSEVNNITISNVIVNDWSSGGFVFLAGGDVTMNNCSAFANPAVNGNGFVCIPSSGVFILNNVVTRDCSNGIYFSGTSATAGYSLYITSAYTRSSVGAGIVNAAGGGSNLIYVNKHISLSDAAATSGTITAW